MAAQTCIQAQHATLTTTTADTILFSGNGGYFRITNRDASVALYCSIPARIVADLVTPVSAADDTFYIAAGSSLILKKPFNFKAIAVVGNANAYSVEIW